MGFGAKLGEILKSRNTTVTELAKQTGISSSTLYAIIRRDSDNVNLSAIQKIASALQIPIENLLPSSKATNSNHILSSMLDIFSGDYVDTDQDILDVHFTTEEFTPDEIADIIQFSEFLKQRRNSPFKKPHTTE
jgi:transcriptional regulator with XRE-family HTH domain